MLRRLHHRNLCRGLVCLLALSRCVKLTINYVDTERRETRAAVARFFQALAAADQGALARLVPDARVRARLPAGLRPEPACDAPEDGARAAVSVAATSADQRPWSLVFRKGGQGWRLTAASPVLQ